MNPDDIIRYQDYDPYTKTYVIREPVFCQGSREKLDDEVFKPIEDIFRRRDERRKSTKNIMRFPVNKNRYR